MFKPKNVKTTIDLKSKQTIYLLFITKGVGGAEKRLIGLWLYLKALDYQTKLVCSESLLNAILVQNELKHIENYQKDIILVPFEGQTVTDTKLLKAFINNFLNEGDILHFVGFYPVLLKRKPGITYLFSFTTSSFNNLNLTGKAYLLISLALADYSDILDPKIYKQVKRLLFFKKNSFFKTSNSFVDADRYIPVYPKKNWVVILGRFEPVKQIMRFVDSLPIINQKIIDAGITNHHFYLLGYGSMEEGMREKFKKDIYKFIPASIQMVHNPEIILASSKAILSLQKGNNYPSKSLLEGMSAGNIPIVTDTGTTELIAPRSFSIYVQENFQPEELSNAIIEILTLNDKNFENVSEKVRLFVKENYTIGKMAEYYITFYQKH